MSPLKESLFERLLLHFSEGHRAANAFHSTTMSVMVHRAADFDHAKKLTHANGSELPFLCTLTVILKERDMWQAGVGCNYRENDVGII